MNISVAFIGFEFGHHVPAAKIAIENLSAKGITCEVKIWSGVEGIKTNVESEFEKCKFFDSHLGWLGIFPDCKSEKSFDHMVSLTDLEIKHLSYTFSRTTFFRNPRNIKKKNINLFKYLVGKCIYELKKAGISHIFFVELPHSLADLAFYYAAQRLDIPIVYKEGPFFGGDYVNPVFEGKRSYSSSKNKEKISETIISSIKNRDLNRSLVMPTYMTADLSYMPTVAPSSVPFYRSQVGYFLFRLLKIKLLATYVERILTRLSGGVSACQRFYLSKQYSSYIELNADEKYILVLLQYHPELTTSPSAMDSPFEEERVIQLAKNFPNHKIIVREHPSNLKKTAHLFPQYRNLMLIRKMTRVKNVFYILPSDRSQYKKLIEQSFFTISTSGTVAIESILLRRPSIHLHNSFATGFPGVHIADSVESISEKLIMSLQRELDNLSDEGVIQSLHDTITQRCMVRGFLSGYHELKYSMEDFIIDASDVMFFSLFSLISSSNLEASSNI